MPWSLTVAPAQAAQAPGDGAVGHALGDDHDPHRQPGHQVGAELVAGHLRQPFQDGDLELLRGV